MTKKAHFSTAIDFINRIKLKDGVYIPSDQSTAEYIYLNFLNRQYIYDFELCIVSIPSFFHCISLV